jgi:dipeptidyl aminopeptidase/acylaminoacyl peptidase
MDGDSLSQWAACTLHRLLLHFQEEVMQIPQKWLFRVATTGLLLVLLIGGAQLFNNRFSTPQTQQENAALLGNAAANQAQPTTEEVQPTPASQSLIISPLPTPLPFPTPVPTPVVTRIPLAKPPLIPAPTGEPAKPYTIFYREDDLVKAYYSSDQKEQVIADVHAQTGLFLGRREAAVFDWGAASPNGEQVALVLTDFKAVNDLPKLGHPGYREPGYSIYLLNLTSTELRLAVENAIHPVWSPDGTRLAFYDRKNRGLGVLTVATGQTVTLVSFEPDSEHEVNWMTWSPDGKRIAFVKTWMGFGSVGGIWIVDTEQPEAAVQIAEMEMNAAALSWSPVANQLLFVSEQGERLTSEIPINLWLIDIESGRKQQLTFNFTLGGGAPTWSPDGNYIAFDGVNMLEQENGQYDIWLMALKSGEISRLTDDLTNDLNPVWSMDDGKLLFNKWEEGVWEFNLVDGTIQKIPAAITSYWFTQVNR